MNKPKILYFDLLPYYRIEVYPDGFVAIYSDSSRSRGKKLMQWLCPSGYLQVSIRSDSQSVHRLIALLALGPRPNGLVINHKDGNKLNNHPDNLEYCTINENIQHSIKMGFHVCNDPKRSGRYKHGKAVKGRIQEYKREWYYANKA